MPPEDRAFPSPRRRRGGGGGGDFLTTFVAEPDARALSLDTACWKEVRRAGVGCMITYSNACNTQSMRRDSGRPSRGMACWKEGRGGPC